MRAQARDNGDLPEQVTGASQFADEVEPWLERWGPVATPLLWSHAMFLISEAVRVMELLPAKATFAPGEPIVVEARDVDGTVRSDASRSGRRRS